MHCKWLMLPIFVIILSCMTNPSQTETVQREENKTNAPLVQLVLNTNDGQIANNKAVVADSAPQNIQNEIVQDSDKLKIEALLVQPVLKAGEKQTAYIKVGLTGFPMTEQKRIAANVAIVLDRSGSMSGEKMRKAREAAVIALQCF